MTSADVSAQSTTTRWTGTDVNSLSKATNSDSGVTGGEWFLLYNVGTGKFLINGGDWGAEGRLFYDDWGKLLKYTSDGLIYTGMETATGAWFWGANVPKITSPETWGSNETFYTLMDARKAYHNGDGNGNNITVRGTRNLIFTPVENSGDDVYTYYISEVLGGSTYYLGGAWGEFRDETDTSRDHGSFVFIDNDRAVWTSENVTTNTEEKEIFGGTKVPANELYQWRIVTLTQFEDQVLANSDEAYGGLSTNVSYRITDQDFSRNIVAFFNEENPPSGTSDLQWEAGWNVKSNATGGTGRYKYTWGWVTDPKNSGVNLESSQCDHLNSGSRYVNEAWDTPVRLKEQFVHDGTGYQKKDCKYGFMSFEGTGTVSSWITAPATGYYQVKCYGFSQSTNSSDDHRGYLFASADNATSGDGYAETYLYQMPSGTYSRTTYAGVKAAGALLTTSDNLEDYQSTVQIYATKDQRIYIGVGKRASTQSSAVNRRYYYDTDWVAVDNFQIIYLGDQGPVVFDEDENTNLDYLKKYDKDGAGNFTNRTVWLKRTFMQNQWNSFVFPLNLTNAQVRTAFGDDAKLAKLHSLGKLSGNPGIIDFQTVNLTSDGTAIEAGNFYIIQPTKAPTTNAATGEKYYTIGRRTFTLSDLPATHSTTVTDKSGSLHISAYATYVNGGQAPANSYVLGTKKNEDTIYMYYLSKATNMKGFRGYLVDEDGALGKKNLDIYLGDYFDDATLYIDGLKNNASKATNGFVYDMMGRKVGNEATVNSLPKGMYIMNGKKFIVK